MGGNNLKRSQKRAIRMGLFFHYVRITAVTAAAVVLVMLVWYFMAPGHSRVHHVESAETVSITPAPKVSESYTGGNKKTEKYDTSIELYEPTKEDGTGEAGIKRVTDDRTGSSGISGWQMSEEGKWYEVSLGICYYGGFKRISGDIYYFDQDGYVATGWKAIAYQKGYYFNSDGVYVPDKEKQKLVALTFENGPTEYTSDILDVLSEYGVKATFFLQGSNIDAYSDIVSRMAALGHTVGNITYTGEDLTAADIDTVIRAFGDTDELIDEYSNLGQATVVRFPNGNYTMEQAAFTGRANIMWDCETYDRETEDAYQIAANVYAQIQGGSVIRMHDRAESTIEALRIFIPELISQGYEFVNIEDMAASRGYELIPGATYLGFKQSDVDAKMVNDR